MATYSPCKRRDPIPPCTCGPGETYDPECAASAWLDRHRECWPNACRQPIAEQLTMESAAARFVLEAAARPAQPMGLRCRLGFHVAGPHVTWWGQEFCLCPRCGTLRLVA